VLVSVVSTLRSKPTMVEARGEKPTISQISVSGVPVIYDGEITPTAASGEVTKRDVATDSDPIISPRIYNLKLDLANPESYLSIYMPNNRALIFCRDVPEESSSTTDDFYHLVLEVRGYVKPIMVPVRHDFAFRFCEKVREGEEIDEATRSKVAGSMKASTFVSKTKTVKNTITSAVDATESSEEPSKSIMVTSISASTNFNL
jgi:hypothetical protein